MSAKKATDLAPGDLVDLENDAVIFGSEGDKHVAEFELFEVEGVGGGWAANACPPGHVVIYFTGDSRIGNPVFAPAALELQVEHHA